jgi:hypothetical protein
MITFPVALSQKSQYDVTKLQHYNDFANPFFGHVRNLWVNVVKYRNFSGIDYHINNSDTRPHFSQVGKDS